MKKVRKLSPAVHVCVATGFIHWQVPAQTQRVQVRAETKDIRLWQVPVMP